MSEDKKKGQKQDDGFHALSGILENLTGSLFDDWKVTPDAIEQGKTKSVKAFEHPSEKLAKAAASIVERPDERELAYQARSMMQCTLPHRDPGDVPIWARRNGELTLMLQPGYDDKTLKSLGLPFGEIPRLLLIWIVSEAVRTKTPRIKLDEERSTLSGFLREIGLDPNTGRGKRSDAKRIKDQMIRLFSCRISFKKSEGTTEKGSLSMLNMEVASGAQLWWDFKNPEQNGLFKSEIILGDNFFKAITTRPIPIDLRAIIALKKSLHQSSFAIDVYMWVTWRIWVMQDRNQAETSIPLSYLQNQFGAEYGRLRDFKAAFEEALNHVSQVFPAFDYNIEKSTFFLRDNKGVNGIRLSNKPPLKERLERPHKEISPKTREWFIENYREWSLSQAIEDFNFWVSGGQTGNPIEIRSVNALFRTFVRDHWTKK